LAESELITREEGRLAVGVLIAVYGGDEPDLFRRALNSILQQRFRQPVEVRIYLGIDGPLPESLQIAVDEFQSRLYKVIRRDTNSGLAATLNSLIAAREEEGFFFRMDADDFSLPQRFQTQLDYMVRNPKVGILGSDIIEVDSISEIRRVVHFCDSPIHARESIHRRVPVAHPSVCFRREVFDLVSGYPLSDRNEDIAMWFKCIEAGIDFDNVREPLLEFRVSPAFWGRRSASKAWREFLTYYAGTRRLWGFNWRLVFPFARLAFRLMPERVVRIGYRMRAAQPLP
jgi:hypothetical protein